MNGLIDPTWSLPASAACVNAGVINLNNLVTGTTGGTWSGTGVDNGIFDPSVGSQNITYTVGIGPCEESLTQMIEVHPAPNVNFVSDVNFGCQDLAVNFSNTSTSLTGNENCTWSLGDGTNVNSCSSFEHIYTSAGTFNLTLTVENEFGCTKTLTEENYIEVSPQPNASFDYQPSKPNVLDSEVTFINNTTGAEFYSWTFGEFTTSSNEHPIIDFEGEAQEVEVMLIATTSLGCVDTVIQIINIEDVLIYYIPNTFTPGDGANPIWQPIFTSGFNPFDYNLLIFNRWGEVVFESNNAKHGWDGTYGANKLAKDGTYVYKIEFGTTMNDERVIVTGHVNLLR